MTTTVSQEAREAAENFMNANGWLCEEDWSLVLEADREVIVKFFAKFEQSIRHQAERETLARMEPVAWQVTFESASGRQWCRKIVLTEPDPKDWDSVTPLYTLPPAPEAGQ